MRIVDLLSRERIELGASAQNKQEVIEKMVELQAKSGALKDKEEYRKAIQQRENLGSTAIEAGIAVPHAKSQSVAFPSLCAMTLQNAVDYDAPDNQPCDLFFMIAAPTDGELHLEILSRLMTLMMNPAFTESLRKAGSPEEFLQIIDRFEQEKYKNEAKEAEQTGYRVLAVTACPTGIAHTYLAAEALEKAGREMGISVKVETNGSAGVKNRLTEQEIEQADGIIVAADRNVETARFAGKKVLSVPVSDGIHKAAELIEKIEQGKAPIYRHKQEENTPIEAEPQKEGIGRQLYKHLMSGINHMLPFVIGGGILIALAFLFDDYAIDPSNFGKNTPLAAYLKTIGEQAFGMMLPVLSGYIAMSIADRPGLAVGFVSGMVAKMGMTFANPEGGAVNAGFLGALFAGFAAGYIVVGLRKLFSRLPKALEGIKPVLLYPVLGILLGAVLTTFINPFMGMINDGLTGFLNGMGGASRVVLGMIVGGMMSIDMGGPFNKAAYVFGTAQLAEGNFEVMASVMAGGMVPPIAIALCTTLFKRKFTKKECQSGLVNYIMGLSFITEGAIPFAASDPLRIIPSCAVGAAVAGGLSMFFGCTLRAPHGGIFVLPTIGNPLGYLAAIVIGSAVGCLILSLLKKNLDEAER